MKPAVRELYASIPPSALADMVLHPTHWTRDGHRIESIQLGASSRSGRYMTCWVEEPAGETYGSAAPTKYPKLVGYHSDGDIAVIDMNYLWPRSPMRMESLPWDPDA